MFGGAAVPVDELAGQFQRCYERPVSGQEHRLVEVVCSAQFSCVRDEGIGSAASDFRSFVLRLFQDKLTAEIQLFHAVITVAFGIYSISIRCGHEGQERRRSGRWCRGGTEGFVAGWCIAGRFCYGSPTGKSGSRGLVLLRRQDRRSREVAAGPGHEIVLEQVFAVFLPQGGFRVVEFHRLPIKLHLTGLRVRPNHLHVGFDVLFLGR